MGYYVVIYRKKFAVPAEEMKDVMGMSAPCPRDT
jgi:hypothetical protein